MVVDVGKDKAPAVVAVFEGDEGVGLTLSFVKNLRGSGVCAIHIIEVISLKLFVGGVIRLEVKVLVLDVRITVGTDAVAVRIFWRIRF